AARRSCPWPTTIVLGGSLGSRSRGEKDERPLDLGRCAGASADLSSPLAWRGRPRPTRAGQALRGAGGPLAALKRESPGCIWGSVNRTLTCSGSPITSCASSCSAPAIGATSGASLLQDER